MDCVGKSTALDDENEQVDASGVGEVDHQAIKISNSFRAIDSTAAMFPQTSRVVKIIRISKALNWVDSGFERFPKRTIADLCLVAPKNHIDDAAFSSACFTKHDDV